MPGYIAVTIEKDIAIGRMIISLMKLFELFVAKIRNGVGIAARAIAINAVGKQGLLCGSA